MRLRFIFLILIQLFCHSSFAAKAKYFSVYTQYYYYTDIVNNSGNAEKELSQDVAFNAELRIYRIFSITGVMGQSLDSSRTFVGIGFKTDLPGIFLLGGSINDLIHRKRRKGMNTYFSFMNHIIQEGEGGDRFVGNRFNWGADIFISDPIYLNLEIGLYSIKGDQFLSPTLGFGVEF